MAAAAPMERAFTVPVVCNNKELIYIELLVSYLCIVKIVRKDKSIPAPASAAAV